MDRFDSMKALVTSVDEGGFAAAGRKLGLSRVQVSRLVTALEDHLSARLLVRTTRTMALTEAGQVFVERARILVNDMEEAEAATGELTGTLTGLLQINAPMTFGVTHIAPAVSDFMRQHADIRVSLSVNDRFVDPYEDGYDLTLRIGDLPVTGPELDGIFAQILDFDGVAPDKVSVTGRRLVLFEIGFDAHPD